MSICKDCIHYEICDEYVSPCESLPECEGGCRCFKDKGEFVEVRHGEWQYEQLDEYKFYKVTCPYCDAYYMGNYDAYNEPDDFNYCPNCGAKMDGEKV